MEDQKNKSIDSISHKDSELVIKSHKDLSHLVQDDSQAVEHKVSVNQGNTNSANSSSVDNNTMNSGPVNTNAANIEQSPVQFHGWFGDFICKSDYWDVIYTNRGVLFVKLGGGRYYILLYCLLGLLIGIIVHVMKQEKRKEIRKKLQQLDYNHLLLVDFEKFEVSWDSIIVKKSLFQTTIRLTGDDGKIKKFVAPNRKEGKRIFDLYSNFSSIA